jgi:broad specificity phosphatase PhoE
MTRGYNQFMAQILLVRSGCTDFDDQGRIKGTLDIPLNEAGQEQVAQLISDLHEADIDQLYSSPCRSALQTAELLAADHQLKVKKLDELQNLDHGLWHGKLIDEVRVSQPKVFRQLQDHPETVCPPEGEPVGMALDRVRSVVLRLIRKHPAGTTALVVPEPLASLIRSTLNQDELGDLWKAECKGGGWQIIDVQPEKVALAT